MPLKLDFENSLLDFYLVDKAFQENKDYFEMLKSKIGKECTDEYCFLNIPSQKRFLKECSKLNEELDNDILIVIGIGGSSLGAKAAYQAVAGRYANILEKKKILFADASDPVLLNKILKLANLYQKNKKRITIAFISKTSATLESIINFNFLYNNFKNKKAIDFVFICNETLEKNFTNFKDVKFLAIPTKLVGRYSVFSSVGLFALSFSTLDVKKFLEGAAAANQYILNQKSQREIFSYAYFLYSNYPQKKIFVNFSFSSSFVEYNNWLAQLIAESISKNGIGLTPYPSIGPNDLHSLAQLYLDGPKDKIFNFLSIENFDEKQASFKFKPTNILDDSILNKKNFGFVYNALVDGVKNAFKNSGLAFISSKIEKLNEFEVGYLMQFNMINTVLVAKLFNVNPFDQPAVENYKREVKNLLLAK